MAEQLERTISEKRADRQLVDDAIRRAVKEAVLRHARAGCSVAVNDNGTVIGASPAETLERYGDVSALGNPPVKSTFASDAVGARSPSDA